MNTFQFSCGVFSCGVGSAACVARQIFSICNVHGDYPRWMHDGIKQIIQLLASYIWSEAKRPGPPGPGQLGFGMGGNKGPRVVGLGGVGGGGWGYIIEIHHYIIMVLYFLISHYYIMVWILDFEGGISYISHINILYMSMSAWCVKVLVVCCFSKPLLAFWCLGHCASRFMFQIKFLKPGQHFSITDLTF